MEENTKPIVSTYIHVSRGAPISHVVDVSSFGVCATIRVGQHGENDAALFLRTPEQLDELADEARRAAAQMRKLLAARAAQE